MLNKKYQIFKIALLILIFTSCKNKPQSIVDSEVQESEVIESEKKVSNDSLTVPLSFLDKEINVQSIKSQLDGVTTTFLSKEDIIFFPDRNKNNFYGRYTLIKNDENGTPSNRVGNMVVYDSINPYVYEKNTDEFVEITLEDKGINLYGNKLKVGMNLSDLIDELGSNYEMRNNTLIYKSKNKIAFLKIDDSLLTKIKIGVYKNQVDVDGILKKSNW